MKKKWETPELLSLNGKDVKAGHVTTAIPFNEGYHVFGTTLIMT